MGATRATSLIAQVKRLQKLQAEALKRSGKGRRRERDPAEPCDPFFAKYRESPNDFARDLLGLSMWSRQRAVLNDLVSPEAPRISVRSGHKVGKSTLDVAAATWFAATRPRARVILTAPTDRQVKGVLWKEIRRVLTPSRCRVLGCSVPGKDPSTGLQWPDGREIFGVSTSQPENLAGFSSPEMLFIVDEASGYPGELFEAIEGNRAGGAGLLMTSNPTQTTGEFFESFNSKRALYTLHHISSAETPNVTGLEPPIPGLAGKPWVEEKRREWGVTSPQYQVRVEGNFPREASGAVIGFGLLEAAKDRWAVTEPGPRLHLGVDVARYGDDESCIVARRGYFVLPPLAVTGFDTQEVAGLVMNTVRALYNSWEAVPVVKVDANGVGAGVVDALKRFSDAGEIVLVEVNASERSDDEERYYNLRSQLHFGAKQFLQDGGTVPEDPHLETEMLAPRYTFDPRGRQRVESKDDIKKRLQRSPDRFDAYALAAYVPTTGRIVVPKTSTSNLPAYRMGTEDRGFG